MNKIDILISKHGDQYRALMPCMKLEKKNFLLQSGKVKFFTDDEIRKNDVVCLSLLPQTNDPIKELTDVIQSSYLHALVPYLNIIDTDLLK